MIWNDVEILVLLQILSKVEIKKIFEANGVFVSSAQKGGQNGISGLFSISGENGNFQFSRILVQILLL